MRNTKLLDLLVNYFFEPSAKPNAEHKSKYLYLLAYACSVSETIDEKTDERTNLNRDELNKTQSFIETAYTICLENKTSSDLLGDVNELFKCIRCAVVSVGIIRWIELTILDAGYFKINSDSSPIHLFLLDEIVNCHTLLHDRVLNLLIKVFETNFNDLDHLLQLQLKKTILDRMVHLMSRGHVIPVVKYINKCWKEQDTDISLIRHFVVEVLDMIGPPYSHEFVNLFLPLIDNENINSSLKSEEEKAIKEFILYCKDMQTTSTVANSGDAIGDNDDKIDEFAAAIAIHIADDDDVDDDEENDNNEEVDTGVNEIEQHGVYIGNPVGDNNDDGDDDDDE